ncbi:MAG: NAD(P)/FAD-dependent oxidoreductase [Phycisphaerales bacterium JB039]
MSDNSRFDVAIVGGGPSGSTVGGLLKVHSPDLKVVIVEKEIFPREHVGESQLPPINAVLQELGAWDEVEAAGFPIKIGASYTWGAEKNWDFDLYPLERFVDEPRPGKLDGQRRFTTFQVERSIYDKILLDRAARLGCDVRQGARVAEIERSGDRIDGFRLADGSRIEADDYIDASGAVGLVRRAMGVETDAPKALRNIAIWDYWDNVKWAVEIGVGATRVQVRSIGFGWLWFIPLGPSRASVGLVCPSEYYQKRQVRPQDLYHEAIAAQPQIAELTRDGTASGEVRTTKDWSHLADRLVGENWWLVGESAGFADPILGAGMTLAHTSARDVACTLLELRRGMLDSRWLRESYNTRTRQSIRQHIQFAQYWYAANGRFTDLQEHCASIAEEAGLSLNPQQAWAWLAQGGFTNSNALLPFFGSYDLSAARRVMEIFAGQSQKYTFHNYNLLKPDTAGATPDSVPHYDRGRVIRIEGVRRGPYFLPTGGVHGMLMQMVARRGDINQFFDEIERYVQTQPAEHRSYIRNKLIQTLETLVLEGWIKGSVNPARPMLKWSYQPSQQIRWAEESEAALKRRDEAAKSN